LLIQPPSVTAVVDRLERQGLVKRTASRTDLRTRQVNLTAQGRKLTSGLLLGHARQIRSLFDGLSRRERDALTGLLGKVESRLVDLASGPANRSLPKGQGSSE
jgi:DNA-binding MarR family transcriptional regulator